MFFGSIVDSDYCYGPRGTYCSIQNQIRCVNVGEYMVFLSIVGSDYCVVWYGMVWPPVIF